MRVNKSELHNRYDELKCVALIGNPADSSTNEVKDLVKDLLEACDSPTKPNEQGGIMNDRDSGFYYMACKLVLNFDLNIEGYFKNVEYRDGKNKIALYRV